MITYKYEKQVDDQCDIEPPRKYDVKIELPQIASDKPTAVILNDKIKKDYNLDKISNQTSRAGNLYITYESIVKDDNIYIVIKEEVDNFCASGDTTYTNYFYDIKNDTVFDYSGAYKKLGFTEQDLRKQDGVPSDFTLEDCKKTMYYCSIKINGDEITPYVDIDTRWE